MSPLRARALLFLAGAAKFLAGAATCLIGTAAAPLPAQVKLPADWAERDLEGKWVFYRQDRDDHAADKDRPKAWAKELARAGDLELLEALGIFEGWRFFGPALAEAKAPQTFRVALWNLGAFDSHNRENAEQALEARADDALAWFLAHPPAQRGKGAPMLAKLQQAVNPSKEPPTQLPPLDPVQVLVPPLDAPAQLDEFGDRLRAEPGRRYVHQVLRALDGVLVYGDVDAMLVPKVLALTRHKNERVRTAAFATLAKVPGELVPDLALLRAADGDGDAEARRLATMALGYANHPRAYFALVRIAAAHDHPGAGNARTLLAGIGDAATLRLLVEQAGGDSDAFAVLAQALEKRLAGLDFSDAGLVQTWLERLAWLRVAADARSERAAEVVLAVLRQRIPGAERERVLQQAAALRPRPPFQGDEAAAMQKELAALAAQLRAPKTADGR